MALIAANLPTIWFLARKWSLKAVSISNGRLNPLSLFRSQRSSLSSQSQHVNPDSHEIHSSSESTQVGVIETTAMRDLESQKDKQPGLIFVQRNISQVEGVLWVKDKS